MALSSGSLLRVLTVAAVLLLGLLLMSGCGGAATPGAVAQTTAEPTTILPQPSAAPTAVSVPPTVAPTNTTAPTATLAPTDTPEPTATATEEPGPTAAVVADASNCVTCHTSEETLQQLAKEEAPAESLSEGEG